MYVLNMSINVRAYVSAHAIEGNGKKKPKKKSINRVMPIYLVCGLLKRENINVPMKYDQKNHRATKSWGLVPL